MPWGKQVALVAGAALAVALSPGAALGAGAWSERQVIPGANLEGKAYFDEASRAFLVYKPASGTDWRLRLRPRLGGVGDELLFPAPLPTSSNEIDAPQVVGLANGDALVAWRVGSSTRVAYRRASDGAFLDGQTVPGSPIALASNAAGEAVIAWGAGVAAAKVARRPAGGPGQLFDIAGAQALDVAGASSLFATVDPSGAAVVAWQSTAAGNVYQRTRAAGATTFDVAGAPGLVGPGSIIRGAQNTAGRSVLLTYTILSTGPDRMQWRAALREPGGAFGTAANVSPALYSGSGRFTGAAAVDDDGRALVIVTGRESETCAAAGALTRAVAEPGQGFSTPAALPDAAIPIAVSAAARGGRFIVGWISSVGCNPVVSRVVRVHAGDSGFTGGQLVRDQSGVGNQIWAAAGPLGDGIVTWQDFPASFVTFEDPGVTGPAAPPAGPGVSTAPPPPAPAPSGQGTTGTLAPPGLSISGVVGISSSGTFSVPVRNLNSTPVDGNLVALGTRLGLTNGPKASAKAKPVTLASAEFKLAAGKSAKVKLRIVKRHRAAVLRKRAGIQVTLRVVLRAGGRSATTTRKVKLRPPRR